MLAYRVNRHNMKSIKIRNGGEFVPLPSETETTTYFIAPGTKLSGGETPAEVVTEPEFFERYQITTRLSRKEGRFVVEEK